MGRVAIVIAVWMAAAGCGGAPSPEGSDDLAVATDLSAADQGDAGASPADLWAGDLAGTGCGIFAACYVDCFNANPDTATAVGCRALCGMNARTGTGTLFDSALSCGQDHCLAAGGDAGLPRCKLAGSSLVNLDGSPIGGSDPSDGSDPQKACGACLHDALARLLGDACVVMSSVDCNPPGCTAITDACLYDGAAPPDLAPPACAQVSVSTLTGNGRGPYVDGTGGPSGTSQFATAGALAVDSAGTIYVADAENHAIRTVTADGSTTTLAGNGTPGYADGSGGLSGTVRFNQPNGIAVDATGTVFVVDSANARIRKIAPDGTTTTLTGSGVDGFADGSGGVASTTRFTFGRGGWVEGIAVDPSGVLYVSDLGNNRIRKVAPDGTTTTLAGNGTQGSVDGTGGPLGTAQFNYPAGLTLDASGNVYVVDSGASSVRKIAPDGSTTTLAGNGTRGYVDGTGGAMGTTELEYPAGLAIDTSGILYLAERGRIRKIAADGSTTTLTGGSTTGYVDGTGGVGGTARFDLLAGIAVDGAGTVFVADPATSYTSRIRKVLADGAASTLSGNGLPGYVDGTGGPNGSTQFDRPTAIAAAADGTLAVTDAAERRVRKIDAGGGTTTLTGNGTSGYVDGTGGANGTAEFVYPVGAAFTPSGDLLVVEGSRIRKVAPDGTTSTFVGYGFDLLTAIAVDTSGTAYVTDMYRVRKVAPDGTVTTLAGSFYMSGYVDGTGGPDGTTRFGPLQAIAVDAAGYTYVGDGFRVRKIAPDGSTTTHAGGASFGVVDGTGGPTGSARFLDVSAVVVAPGGELLVSDRGRIRRVAADGTTTTLLGDAGYADGPGCAARIAAGPLALHGKTLSFVDGRRIRQVALP